jgi:hypothetical protein
MIMTTFNLEMTIALVRETEQEHAKVEKTLPKHEWQNWYGAFMTVRMEREENTRETASEFASDYIRLISASGLNPPAPATTDGVTIIDGTEVCDECGANVPTTGSMVNPRHNVNCSLHPRNVVG